MMWKRFGAWIIPLSFMFVTPGGAQQDADESLQIYETVLDSIRSSGRTSYFLASQTVALTPTEGWERSLQNRPSLPADVVRRLLALNTASISLAPTWVDSASTIPVDPRLEEQMVSSNWRIAFSRVGYSEDEKTALVYVMEVCGGRCGSGDVVRLRKQEDRWRIDHWEILMRF